MDADDAFQNEGLRMRGYVVTHPSHLGRRPPTPGVPQHEVRGHQRLDLERAEAAGGGRLGLFVGVREVEEEGEELEVVAVDVVAERAVVEPGRYRGGEQPPPRVVVVIVGSDAPTVQRQKSRVRHLWKGRGLNDGSGKKPEQSWSCSPTAG